MYEASSLSRQVRTCIFICIHMYMNVYVHRYIYTYIHTRPPHHRATLAQFISAPHSTSLIFSSIYVYIHIFTFVHVCICPEIQIYIDTYIHKYVYTYIHEASSSSRDPRSVYQRTTLYWPEILKVYTYI